ncbi:MFS general substrate transporter [Basidiobolus meristosporus CBS 931.73]|uniref:MFS general substrate transporter n=1 Tax=Basidiobolus meristosporus CBS 931.73 TaxID=1314790 RepID=A0A1Y1Z0H3_9FUNG|nr:MFS general substrate transporter [Basidiobolus meristosporus CBS 931.73]|eukprot:ORY03792.1 MFS general substrate transporter [Basidiobolus meristosporus CBS 931.73]
MSSTCWHSTSIIMPNVSDPEKSDEFQSEKLTLDEDSKLDVPPEGGYGWVVVLSSFLIHFVVLGVQYSWGIYQQYYLSHTFAGRVKASSLSLVGTIGAAAMPICGIVTGRLADRYGFKLIAFCGTATLTLGLILASFAKELWHLYLTQGLLYGVGSSLCFFPAISVPSQWFKQRRGLAVGIAVSGSGIGGLALGPATDRLISSLGHQWALRVTGIFSFVLLSVACILLRTRAKTKVNSPIIDVKLFKNPKFIIMCLGGVTFSFGYLIPMYYIPDYASSISLSASSGALIVGLLNGASALGRVLLGTAADRFGRLNLLVFCMLVGSLSTLIIWPNAGSFAPLLIFALLFGFTAGGFISLFPVVIANIFGLENLATVTGLVYASTGVGNLAGSPTAGALHDSTSDYLPVILLSGVTMVFGTLVNFGLRMMVERKLFAKA